MTIRNRLSFLFTGIVTATILIFSFVIYILSERNRQDEFIVRLQEKAVTSVQLVTQMDDLEGAFLQKFTQSPPNSNSFLDNEAVTIYLDQNPKYPEIFTSGEMQIPSLHQYFVDIKTKKARHVMLDDGSEMVGIYYANQGKNYVAVAKAIDQYGLSKISNLKRNLFIASLLTCLVSFLISLYYSHRALKPINKIIRQVSNINFKNLSETINGGENEDEIQQLANSFNGMMGRLKNTFDAQKSFVSNASHELRTPLTAMNGQIEVALMKERKNEDYHKILNSLKEDIHEMTDLSNSLLDLASVDSGIASLNFENIRIDEIIWQAQEEISQKRPNAKINIDFGTIPTDDLDFLMPANEQLLKTAFKNLIDNGCKYSDNEKVTVKMYFEKNIYKFEFINTGKAIEKEDLNNLFIPFYRSANTQKVKGHGIGLPLTKKIVELHNGKIEVISTPNENTIFLITFKII